MMVLRSWAVRWPLSWARMPRSSLLMPTLRTIPGLGDRFVERAPFLVQAVQVVLGKPLEPWRSTASPQFLGCWDQRGLVL